MEDEKERLKAMIGTEINRRWIITRYISSGSFGDVFECKDKTDNNLYALKIPIKTDLKDGEKSLIDEAKVYKILLENSCKGISNVKMIRDNVTKRKIMVMDLLGQSLETLITKHKRFALKTVILLAISMIDIAKHIHSSGFVHRDIKPDNFVIGATNRKDLYCIDFGLAKPYVNRSGKHISPHKTKKFCGTARFASIAAHRSYEQSRKDDLESIGYILVYLYKSVLPWQSIKCKDKKQRYKLIGEKKESITEEELCKGMPKEFTVFLKYVRSLDFDETPYYSALIKMFKKLYESRGYKNNNLEWE